MRNHLLRGKEFHCALTCALLETILYAFMLMSTFEDEEAQEISTDKQSKIVEA
jgi:hypothetical protein